jgi:O-antigen biosynthesis protein
LPVTPAAGFHPAFVVPRYGEEVIGGAENLARLTAEELARRGFRVSALTTQALDHHTWKNHYPAGESTLGGVNVKRFPAETRLGDPAVRRVIGSISSGGSPGEDGQALWLSGVVTSEGLLDHIRKNARVYSHLVFLPYLFGTTYFGSMIAPERSYIIPCLHDEPFAHQSLISGMLTSVKGLIFNSPGERRLASRLLGVSDPGPVVGMGLHPENGDGFSFRDRYPVRGNFLLYSGRREPGKNTPMLIDYFRRYAARNPSPASLVLIGSGDVRIPPDSSHFIFDLGVQGEREKWDAYSAARVFCQPSVNESFSIVLLEAWLTGTPALVNRDCDVTVDHVRASGGGLTFGDYPGFSEALTALLEDGELARKLGAAGRRYVEEEYNWDSVIKRLLEALGVG